MSNEKNLTALRKFLRLVPQPDKVRMRKDDEAQDIALSPIARQRWKIAEETCVAWGAEYVDCLTSKGELIRSYTMPSDEERAEVKSASRAVSEKAAEYSGVAHMIRAIAEEHNLAFDKGADATARALESQTNLVELLTTHLTMAITSMYNVSANYAALLQGKEPDEQSGTAHQALAQLAAVALSRIQTPSPTPAAAPNGAKKHD